jgi:protein SCO1/2
MGADRRAISRAARTARRWARSACAAAVLLCVSAAPAQLLRSAEQVPELQGVDLNEHPGAQLPLDAVFTDHAGRPVPLSTYFDGSKPAVLVLAYYDCPVVCTLVLDRVAETVQELDYTVGTDFNIVVVSFDESEGTTEAAAHRMAYLSGYKRGQGPAIAAGWNFHTGDQVNIDRLTQAVGFEIRRLPNGEFSHPVGIMIVSPTGVISRYMYGYEYPPKQVKLALLDATEGKIAQSLGDRIMHFCFRFDPNAGKYSLQAMAVMRLAGAATVVFLAVTIGGFFVWERRRRSARPAREQQETPTPRVVPSRIAQAVGTNA